MTHTLHRRGTADDLSADYVMLCIRAAGINDSGSKEADLGLSVVVSGILDPVNECCQKAGLKRHTVEFSLGIWGKTEKLPSNDILEITTMCGHAMVSAKLVESMVGDIKKGIKSPHDAAKELTSHCCCGVFNPARATKLLAAMAGLEINT